MKYSQLQKEALKRICRRCINEKYQLNLLPEDCRYFDYPRLCPRCEQMRNMPEDVRFFHRWKLWIAGK